MVISWTPSGAVVTTPTPVAVDGAALWADEASPPQPASRTTAAAITAAFLVIEGAPYAWEARPVRDPRPSARRRRRRRRRPDRAASRGAAPSPGAVARPARPTARPGRPPRGSPRAGRRGTPTPACRRRRTPAR